MRLMKSLNQYLKNRHGRWYYRRRVPTQYADLDNRVLIITSLRTSSLEIARARRDALADADDLYWVSLMAGEENGVAQAAARYESAKKRALAKGFVYVPVDELAQSASLKDLLSRLMDISKASSHEEADARALLGTEKQAAPKISKALDMYCDRIATSETHGNSKSQTKSWRKVKQRAVKNFINLYGDLRMDEITREHGKGFFEWWNNRVYPEEGKKSLSPNSANRDLGNLRKLFQTYWEYEGDENRHNPFRNLRFNEGVKREIPPFETDWLLTQIMKPGQFEGLNMEATLIVYAMIETGCRPSEIANILPENIILDHYVPHLRIKSRDDRKLKTKSSAREIPLIGVSLEAMKRAPNGFPRYRDRGDSLSALLLKAFRVRNLFPTADHRIYSIRHSFEKRMLEAGIDYGLRCTLMGHHNSRPAYGDGGSLAYRRDEMLKFVLPVTDEFRSNLPQYRIC